MQLPEGITGFFDEKTQLSEVDSKVFRTICYDVSLNSNVTLLSIRDAHYPMNYLCAKFAVNDEPVQVLLNAYYPFVTSTVIEEQGHLVFCELPKELQQFAEKYTFLTDVQLDTPLNKKSIEQLSKVEREQINHWSPNTIGEIVFNAWD